MLQSSSSSSPLGQSVAVTHHHYKKFWILQTMMDQSKLQDQACNNHTATTTANFSGSSISVATPLTPALNSHQNNNTTTASSPSSTATSTFRDSASFNSSDNFSSHTNSDHQAFWSNDSPQSQLINPAIDQSLVEIPALDQRQDHNLAANDKFTSPAATNSCSITHPVQGTTTQEHRNNIRCNNTYNLTRIRNRTAVNNAVVMDCKSNDLFPSGGARNFVVRTCTLCGTTKTPLWRSGPEGPKSLCNACGIRVKKSRRLQLAMESSERSNELPDPSPFPSPTPKSSTTIRPVKRKFICNDNEDDTPMGEPDFTTNIAMKTKRKDQTMSYNKNGERAHNNDHDEDMGYCVDAPLPWSSTRDTGFVRRPTPPTTTSTMSDATAKFAKLLNNRGRVPKVFAKDEEEAAVLLMALSCGLALS